MWAFLRLNILDRQKEVPQDILRDFYEKRNRELPCIPSLLRMEPCCQKIMQANYFAVIGVD
jgi:hypothetical protein